MVINEEPWKYAENEINAWMSKMCRVVNALKENLSADVLKKVEIFKRKDFMYLPTSLEEINELWKYSEDEIKKWVEIMDSITKFLLWISNFAMFKKVLNKWFDQNKIEEENKKKFPSYIHSFYAEDNELLENLLKYDKKRIEEWLELAERLNNLWIELYRRRFFEWFIDEKRVFNEDSVKKIEILKWLNFSSIWDYWYGVFLKKNLDKYSEEELKKWMAIVKKIKDDSDLYWRISSSKDDKNQSFSFYVFYEYILKEPHIIDEKMIRIFELLKWKKFFEGFCILDLMERLHEYDETEIENWLKILDKLWIDADTEYFDIDDFINILDGKL